MSNFITNGFKIVLGDKWNNTLVKHSLEDFGLAIKNTNYVGTPEVETYLVDVPGGGVLDLSETLTGEPVFKQRTLSFEVGRTQRGTAWDSIMSEFYNQYHARRVCISVDSDDDYYYNGRCYVEGFESKRGLGTFTLRIVADAYKFNKSDVLNTVNYRATKTNEKIGEDQWVTATSNSIWSEDDLTRIQGIIMGTITPTQADLDKYDFFEEGRVSSRSYTIAKKYVGAILLPLDENLHTPIMVNVSTENKEANGLEETIYYHPHGTLKNYTLKTWKTGPHAEEIRTANKDAVIEFYNSDNGQTMSYSLTSYEQSFPNLFTDSNGTIKIKFRNRCLDLVKDDTFTLDGTQYDVASSEKNINKKVDIRYRERSL